jgi:ABC-type uncharacterized transport system fused permease/ATPase subunit
VPCRAPSDGHNDSDNCVFANDNDRFGKSTKKYKWMSYSLWNQSTDHNIDYSKLIEHTDLISGIEIPPSCTKNQLSNNYVSNVDPFLSSSNPRSLISINGLNLFSEECGTKILVRELTFTLQEGMRLLITGLSGCGKSTLLKAAKLMKLAF